MNILAKLNKIALKFLETTDLKTLQEIIVHEGLRIVNARYGTIYLVEKRNLQRVYTTVPSQLQVKIRKNGYTYRAFRSRKVLWADVDSVGQVHREIKDFAVKSVVFIPLSYRKTCIGVLSLDSNKNNFSEEELYLLKLYGAMATLAIKQALHDREMQRSLELRDLFISLTAHEFRTPLTTINGYAHLLKRKLKDDDTVLRSWSEELYREVRRLVDMTNELLEVSRIKSGKIDFSFQMVGVENILQDAMNRFRFSYPSLPLDTNIQLHSIDEIVADPDKLLQVLTNILENAGKFSPPEKAVRLVAEERKNWIVIAITDQGKGIHKEELESIFLGFYKGKNTDEKQGMGLGLFISKSIMDAHHGKLKVKSRLGHGTTFEIWLPRQHD